VVVALVDEERSGRQECGWARGEDEEDEGTART
jgi:hypothetical protein